MGCITKDYIDCDAYQVDFVGWTYFGNTAYPDFMDVFDEYSLYTNETFKRVDGSTFCMRKRHNKTGYEDVVARLQHCQETAFDLLVERLKATGIRFSGEWHQNGDYGCPVIRISKSHRDEDHNGKVWASEKVEELEGLEIKLTCTFRSWGGFIAEALGEGSYTDWAWGNSKDPIFPDAKTQNENCIPCKEIELFGVVADAYDPEFDVPMGD